LPFPTRWLKFVCALCAIVICAPIAAQTSTASDVVAGTPGIAGGGVRITTAELMRQQEVRDRTQPRVVHKRPVLRPDRRGLPQNPDSPALPPPSAKIAPGGAPAFKIAQTLSTTFLGATLSETGAFPPDSMGAVGPTQFFVTLNGRFRTFNKATGVADGAVNVDSDTFFASVMTPIGGGVVFNFTSDPRVRFDRLSGHWFIEMIDVPLDGGGNATFANRSMLAMSDSGTITGGTVWTYFFFAPGETAFLDYCTMGIDVNALYIGCNVFSTSSGAFLHTSGYVVRKSSVVGGGPIVVTNFLNLTPSPTFAGPFTPQGVDNYDPAATEGYFIGVDNATFGTLSIRRVSTPGGTPTISGNIQLTVASTAFPKTVPHLGNTGGTNGQLDSLDDRLFAAHIRNGRLWTAHNILVNTSGVGTSAGTRDGSRWYELQNLTGVPSVVQSGTLFDSAVSNPRFHWIPTIMVSGQGHAVMGYSEAGLAEHANAGFAGRLVGDSLGTLQAEVPYTSSAFAYNPPSDPGGASGRRWGDYSFTSVDPSDDMTMWTIQEFTSSTNNYGVQVAKLLAPPPATPSSVAPNPIAGGLASVIVTVTGTSSGGSGFFDPGAGFTNRIQASVSGGVTVNSVTYNSPTSVTLDLSTVGATGGAKNVTITNPDGQSASGTGILTVTSGSPIITSANNTTFTVGSAGTFTVTASGTPASFTFSETGALPAVVTFNTLTGVLAGTPAPGTGGTYPLGLTASNGVLPDGTQSFTLNVNEPPTISSTNYATFTAGVSGAFSVTATGFPASTFGEIGSLPAGLSFSTSTGAFTGTPAAGTAGTYNLTVNASNGVAPGASQSFTLIVTSPLLVFTPTVPCRVVDTRSVGGAIAAGTSRRFFFYSDGTPPSWASQGGAAGIAASACPGTTLTSAGGTLGNLPPLAAVLTVTVVNATAAGNFVVWGGGPPSSIPNTSMLNWTAGQVLANTGAVPAGGRGSVEDFEVRYNGPSGQADVIVDVVGYVIGNNATALQCATQVASGVGTHSNATAFMLLVPACPTGYTATHYACSSVAALPADAYLQEIAPTSGQCTWFNNTGGSISATNYRAETVCCRVPGQ
jgi:putative Ig domain-containing protein